MTGNADAVARHRVDGPDFESFVGAHGRSLLRLAYLLTGDHGRAEDLLQDTLTAAYQHWPRVTASALPYAYVRRILLNRHTSTMRRRSSGERPTDPAELPDPGTPDESARVVAQIALWQQLSHLPTRMRQVLVLRYFEDLDDTAIAEVLGISVSGVRSTASRAIAHLREMESP